MTDTVLIRLYTLGQFRLERYTGEGWQSVTAEEWQHPRVRTLLGSLAGSSERTLSRKQIIRVLWPDLNVQEEAGTDHLQRVISSLQRVLAAEPGPAGMSHLYTAGEQVTLAGQSQVWIDADAFEELLDDAQQETDPAKIEVLLGRAVSLYKGDFLPEERTADWADLRRKRLYSEWLASLLELADIRIARGNVNEAIEPLDLLLTAEPAHEGAVQRLLFLLAQMMRRGEALQAYQRFAAMLERDHATTPSPNTNALYEAVRQGEDIGEYALQVGLPLSTASSLHVSAPGPSWQIGRSHYNRLVGRDDERVLLHERLLATEQMTGSPLSGEERTRSNANTGQSLLLMGEAGIGKTRLAEEISREAQQRGWVIAWSRVYAQESHIPYQVWIEALRSAMAQGLWQQQEEVQKHPHVYQSLCKLLPELYDLLPGDLAPLPVVPEQEQLRLWEAVFHVFKTLSQRAPLLLVLDDLQWIDSGSRDLLAYIVRRLPGHSVLLVATYRENELPSDHPLRTLIAHLQRERVIDCVAIQPLTNDQISVLVEQAKLPQPMIKHIQTQAAGNPFFAEELARVSLSEQSPPAALPDSIAAVLDLRLGKLSQACQQLLNKAVVLGGFFEFHWLYKIESGSKNTHVDEEKLVHLLEESLAAGVLTEEGSGTHIRYHFWHPLLVSHLYEKLSAVRRTLTHRQAADLFRQIYQAREEEGAAMITHHLVQGGAEDEQITHYAELAGNRAYRLLAYPDAERYFRLAEEAANRVKASEETLQEQLHRADILERLGECSMIRGNYDEARRFYEQVLEIHKKQHTFPSQEAFRQEAQLQALLWCEVGWTWRYTGDGERALECGERGAQVLGEAGVTGGPAWARIRYQQCSLYWQSGKYDEAREAGQEALRLFEEALLHRKLPPVDSVPPTRTRRTLEGNPVDFGRTHGVLGGVAVSAGQPAVAIVHFQTALSIFTRYDHIREIAHVCCNLGYAHMRKAEHIQARATFQRALDLAERIGDTPLTAVITNNLGELAARSGSLPEAEDLFKRSISQGEPFNDREYMSSWRSTLAVVLMEQGKLVEAGVYIRQAIQIARAIKNIPCIGLALVTLAQLRVTQAHVLYLALPDQDTVAQASHPVASLPVLPGAARRLLRRGQATIQHALTLEGIDAEVKTRAYLLIAQVTFLLGDPVGAHRQAILTLKEAEQRELTWLIAQTQRLLGSVLAVQGQQEQASQAFEQAIAVLQNYAIRLEYGRTLRSYGLMLVQWHEPGQPNYQKGVMYLRQAQELFAACHAALDSHNVERLLRHYPHS